ncbi:MAG: hypothetical protein ABW090_14235 [Sedimenticola sp.]
MHDSKKKSGRPGRKITQSNFHEVLQDYGDSNSWPDDLVALRSKAPGLSECDFFVEKALHKAQEHLIELQKGVGNREGGIVAVNIWMHEDALERAEASVTKWKKVKRQSLPAELVTELQRWIWENVSKDEWERYRNKKRVRKAKQKARLTQISVDYETAKKLRAVKGELDCDNWSELMAQLMSFALTGIKSHRSLDIEIRAKLESVLE